MPSRQGSKRSSMVTPNSNHVVRLKAILDFVAPCQHQHRVCDSQVWRLDELLRLISRHTWAAT